MKYRDKPVSRHSCNAAPLCVAPAASAARYWAGCMLHELYVQDRIESEQMPSRRTGRKALIGTSSLGL